MMDWQDTIVAPATPAGPGPRAIIRVAGPRTHSIVRAVLAASRIPPSSHPFSVTEVAIDLKAWSRQLDATLYLWPKGRSYTGQPTAELHVPNSPPLLAALETQILAAGARRAGPGEFTLRAFLAGRLDLEQAEGVLALIEADDRAALKDAIDQRAGGLSRPIEELRQRTLDLLADLEASLDFSAEDITLLSAGELTDRLVSLSADLDSLARHLAARAIDSDRPSVLLLGPVNAGKSSLFNALAASSKSGSSTPAIVSPHAGTTRDLLRAPLDLGTIHAELWDSAGLDCPTDPIATVMADPIGVMADRQRDHRARAADLILWCVPADQAPIEPPDNLTTSSRVLCVRTKRDLMSGDAEAGVDVSVSSVTGEGLADLRALMADSLGQVDRQLAGGSRVAVSERCRAALDAARADLAEAHRLASETVGPEWVAVALRGALDHVGTIGGAVFTDDLLDRVFSRFCIGK